MKYFFLNFLLAILSFNLSSAQVQSLCKDARDDDPTTVYANDPSGCDRYLHCTFDANGEVTLVSQMTCPASNPNFFKGTCYATTAIDCTETIGTEPPGGTGNDIELCPRYEVATFYADKDDTGCQKYFFCRAQDPTSDPAIPIGSAMSCTGSLLFNRDSGQCSVNTTAPCLTSGETPTEPVCECKEDGGGFVSCDECTGTVTCESVVVQSVVPGNCAEYLICFEGNELGRGNCGPDLVFNPDPSIRQCDRSDNLNQLYPCGEVSSATLKIPPAPISSIFIDPSSKGPVKIHPILGRID